MTIVVTFSRESQYSFGWLGGEEGKRIDREEGTHTYPVRRMHVRESRLRLEGRRGISKRSPMDANQSNIRVISGLSGT